MRRRRAALRRHFGPPLTCEGWYNFAARMQPHRDVKIVDSGTIGLDPSVVPPEEWEGARGAIVKKGRSSVLCIDATRPWPYKPTSLPKREFMEKALEIWNRLELPPLHLKSPWHGYELGHWSGRNSVNDSTKAVSSRGSLRPAVCGYLMCRWNLFRTIFGIGIALIFPSRP